MGKLDNRVAVVTGAAQGIGKAVADKLAAEGATVVGADIQPGTTLTVDVSKEDVFAFTRALAREIGQYGITVNAVAPGLTETEGVMASPHKEAFEFVQMLQCIPRRGVAADIAPAVAFLASEEAGWVTGQLL